MTPTADFSSLAPSDVLDAVEAVIGRPVRPPVVAYPSYINRVYRVDGAPGLAPDGAAVPVRYIAKFYRPGRWPAAALAAEHAFAAAAAEAGLQVAAPLADAEGATLHYFEVDAAAADGAGADGATGSGGPGFYFAVYPFIPGRGWEPSCAADWYRLGERIAALHRAGQRLQAPGRPRLNPGYVRDHAFAYLRSEGVIHPDCRADFEEVCSDAFARLEPRFDGVPVQTIHGDLHRGNLLTASPSSAANLSMAAAALGAPAAGGGTAGGEPLFIDFDDMAVGPTVQDLWLFLPGRRSDSRAELAELLAGYDNVARFDRTGLDLIESLRFLRILSYLAWQARQRSDRGFAAAFPDWGTRSFWIKETEDLRDQLSCID
jgi:Ser/Thr protein kinase RdoA (MazF antagonist)